MGQYHYRNPLHQMEQNAKDKNPIKTVNFEQYAERHMITNRLIMPVFGPNFQHSSYSHSPWSISKETWDCVVASKVQGLV